VLHCPPPALQKGSHLKGNTVKTRINRIAPIALLALMSSGAVWASPDLAQKKNCMACHAVDKKLVGPSFKDIAKKYAGQADASNKLVQKVLKGGAGAWGPLPMPANPQVSEAEAKTLVQWVLAQK
jgi:cytochrome c